MYVQFSAVGISFQSMICKDEHPCCGVYYGRAGYAFRFWVETTTSHDLMESYNLALAAVWEYAY